MEIISRLLHEHTPNLGGMNGDVQSDLATLAFNNGEEPEYFHIRIIRLQKEINHSGENLYPTRLLYSTKRNITNRDKIKAFVVPKMIDTIKLLDNNKQGNIHGLYHYLETIQYPTNSTSSGQYYHHFGTSSSTNNNTETLQTVIAAICV